MRPAAPGSRAACTVPSICDASSLGRPRPREICGSRSDSQAVGALCTERDVGAKAWI